MEGPDPEMQEEGIKKESSWEVIREWFRTQKGLSSSSSSSATNFSMSNLYGNIPAKRQDLRLLLGVLGCPLAPIPLANPPIHHIRVKDIPIVCFFSCVLIMFYVVMSVFITFQKQIFLTSIL